MQKLSDFQPQNSKDDTKYVLNAFLSHLPKDGKMNLLKDIRSFTTDSEIRQHSRSLVEGLLLPLRAHPETPSITTSPCFGINDSIKNLASELDDSVTRNDQKWLKNSCLARDGYKCCISGAVDRHYAGASDVAETDTECAHIIPVSLRRGTIYHLKDMG